MDLGANGKTVQDFLLVNSSSGSHSLGDSHACVENCRLLHHRSIWFDAVDDSQKVRCGEKWNEIVV